MTDFQKFIQKLQQAKVPCRVKLFNTGNITVECGFNFPDEVFFQVDEIADEVGVEVDVCAEIQGGVLEVSQNVNGGPRRYSYV